AACAPQPKVGTEGPETAVGHGAACPAAGTWFAPAEGRQLTTGEVLDRLADSRVVLLTELHDRADHHRWQVQMLAALHAQEPDMAVGFEMFPRKVQPVLDRWRSGALDEVEFLEQADWWRHWGFDPDLYLPLFHFVRLNDLDMRALNLDRPIIARVAQEGLEWVPPAERRGVTDPAPLSQGYLDRLLEAYRQHLPEESRDNAGANSEGFQHFVEAQAVRDRAMAEALADALVSTNGAPARRRAVGILGRGHADHGDGVPAQLLEMGVAEVTVLTPWSPGEECQLPEAGLADAVFLLGDNRPAPPPKRLGVHLKPGDNGGLQIFDVQPDSPAMAAGLQSGDRIVEAGGRPVTELADLQLAIWQSGQGGALPLVLERDGQSRTVLVRLR
ncbi:MAG: ChaN family lipoprotein, partial [Rhodovibrionaceae bacterium]|nr:ChaN family lipoprotein [Rhodovibrionaceae bacterium]